MMFSMGNDIKAVSALVPAIRGASAADFTGADVNRAGFDALSYVINFGAEADTLSGSVKFDIILEHADDNGSGAPGTYAAVAATDIVIPNWATNMAFAAGGIVMTVDAAVESPAVGFVDYVGGKQWSRLKIDATGTTTGQPISAEALLMKPNLAPVA